MNIWQPQYEIDKKPEFTGGSVYLPLKPIKLNRKIGYSIDISASQVNNFKSIQVTSIVITEKWKFRDIPERLGIPINRPINMALALEDPDYSSTATVTGNYQYGSSITNKRITPQPYNSKNKTIIRDTGHGFVVETEIPYSVHIPFSNIPNGALRQLTFVHDITPLMLWIPQDPHFSTRNLNNWILWDVDITMKGFTFENARGWDKLENVFSPFQVTSTWQGRSPEIYPNFYLMFGNYQPEAISYTGTFNMGADSEYIWLKVFTASTMNKWLEELKNLSFPAGGYSLPHHNHSWSENGITYYSTRPSSRAEESQPEPNTPWFKRFLYKLIRRRLHEKQ